MGSKASPRRELREALQQRLLPQLKALGFEPVPLARDERNRSFKWAFPFGGLRRDDGDRCWLLEIQFDKSGAAAVRLQFGEMENAAFNAARARDISTPVHGLKTYYTVSPLLSWFGFFKVRPLPWQTPKRDAQEKLATKLVGLVPDIEAVIEGRSTGGRHIRRTRMDPWPGPAVD